MEHDRWTESLSRLFDDDLSGPEKAAVESHLASCNACAKTWHLWSDTRQSLSSLKASGLGPGFRAQVMAALDTNQTAVEPHLTWAPWLGLAAAAALTLAVSLPTPGTEVASADPTGLTSLASANTLPSNPLPDWMMEEEK